jgi:hypothetical protein
VGIPVFWKMSGAATAAMIAAMVMKRKLEQAAALARWRY